MAQEPVFLTVLSESDPRSAKEMAITKSTAMSSPRECAEKLPVTEGTGTEMGHCKHSQPGQGHREGVRTVVRA